MNTPTVYVICDTNCKFEGMTREQILSAITQAVNDGEISDIDAGFITKIKELNSGENFSIWVGTQAQYNALTEINEKCLYIITDDSEIDDLRNAVNEILEGVGYAENAGTAGIANKALAVETYDVDIRSTYPLACVDNEGKIYRFGYYDAEGNFIWGVNANNAICDSEGNKISESYVCKKSATLSKLCCGLTYSLGELPAGKTLNDVMAVSFKPDAIRLNAYGICADTSEQEVNLVCQATGATADAFFHTLYGVNLTMNGNNIDFKILYSATQLLDGGVQYNTGTWVTQSPINIHIYFK